MSSIDRNVGCVWLRNSNGLRTKTTAAQLQGYTMHHSQRRVRRPRWRTCTQPKLRPTQIQIHNLGHFLLFRSGIWLVFVIFLKIISSMVFWVIWKDSLDIEDQVRVSRICGKTGANLLTSCRNCTCLKAVDLVITQNNY